jgi:hypothetical protein
VHIDTEVGTNADEALAKVANDHRVTNRARGTLGFASRQLSAPESRNTVEVRRGLEISVRGGFLRLSERLF